MIGLYAAIGIGGVMLTTTAWLMWHINHLSNLETKRIEQVYGFKRRTLRERLRKP